MTDSNSTLVSVTVELPIVSSVEGRNGVWSLMKLMHLARVPVAGDQIEFAEDWGCSDVMRVILSNGGGAEIRLQTEKVATGDGLDALNELVAMHDWKRV